MKCTTQYLSINDSKSRMPLSHCSHWIFDMDGTLTLPMHDFDDIRAQLGISAGVPILEAIDVMPADRAAELTQELHAIEMKIAGQAQAQPGARELLQAMQQHGLQLGILTRNGKDIALATLAAAGLEFFAEQHIIGRECCAPKPSPAGVNLLLDQWGAPQQQTVMVGDFLYDIEAGRHAGVNTVHFDQTGVFQWPEYTDHKISEFSDLAKLIGLRL
ncbi:MAG: HAD family hydrolase [Pseudomonadota bacterium]